MFKRLPEEERKQAAEKAKIEAQKYFSSEKFTANKRSRQIYALCLLIVGLPIIGIAAAFKLNPKIMLGVAFALSALVSQVVQYRINKQQSKSSQSPVISDKRQT